MQMSLERIGNYEVLGELGRGGMGVVYRGVDSFIKRPVAIKTIYLSEIQEDHERQFLKERLYREAQSAGILSHPNIVTIYQIGEQDDLTYIVMEFVEGKNLAQVLRSPDKPSVELLLSIFEQTAAGLDHAHAQGVVHRDVKPANIIVRSDGVAKITDFGVAKITSQTVTRTGMTLGTPHYMAPEQIQGKPIDGRADQYALGVVIYEIFTGHKPFKADTITSLIFKIVTDAVEPRRDNPNLSDAVSDVLKRALAKESSDRYPSCQALVQAFRDSIGMPSSQSLRFAGGAAPSTGINIASGTISATNPVSTSTSQAGVTGNAPPFAATQSAGAAMPTPTPTPTPTPGAPTSNSAITRPPAPAMPPIPPARVPPPAPMAPSSSDSQPVRNIAQPERAGRDGSSWRFPLIAAVSLLAVAVIFGLVWVMLSGNGTAPSEGTKQTAGSGTASEQNVGERPADATGAAASSTIVAPAPPPALAANAVSETKPHTHSGSGGATSALVAKPAVSRPATSTAHPTIAGSSAPPVAVKPSGTGSNPPAGSTPETSSPGSAPAKAAEVPEPARPEPRAQPVFTSPKPIVRVPAIYPAAARRDGISGTVLLQAVVNEAGQPTAVNVMRGIRADLDQAAKDALVKWRFQPGTSDGKPVESRVNVEISFSLVQDQRKPISLKNP